MLRSHSLPAGRLSRDRILGPTGDVIYRFLVLVPCCYASNQVIPGNTAETEGWRPSEARSRIWPDFEQSAVILFSVIPQLPCATIEVPYNLEEYIQDRKCDDKCIRGIVRRLTSTSQKIQSPPISPKSDVGRVARNPYNRPNIWHSLERQFMEEAARYNGSLVRIDEIRGLDCPGSEANLLGTAKSYGRATTCGSVRHRNQELLSVAFKRRHPLIIAISTDWHRNFDAVINNDIAGKYSASRLMFSRVPSRPYMFTCQADSTVTEWTGVNLGGLVQGIWCSRYLVTHLDFQVRQIIGQNDATTLKAVTSFINTALMSNPQHK